MLDVQWSVTVKAVQYALFVLQETYFAASDERTCDMTDDMGKAKMLQVMQISAWIGICAHVGRKPCL
jgi:hypothetical protein